MPNSNLVLIHGHFGLPRLCIHVRRWHHISLVVWPVVSTHIHLSKRLLLLRLVRVLWSMHSGRHLLHSVTSHTSLWRIYQSSWHRLVYSTLIHIILHVVGWLRLLVHCWLVVVVWHTHKWVRWLVVLVTHFLFKTN